ncbi:MAG: coaE [Clostridia bacterium]|jgi:dephospho-CoA kinase|uniref:dephospho-CoA kinase n=1 Tax=Petroclostridium xylanilyticum TaxID=1792311 RepID=UPI000B98A7D2|nr:dephospho-CoA kinase [Petroclostridium xylanilyticum]MBZ4645795.1 coaE [Clostridia bacterium]
MKIIGLTGGTGSGKSTVAGIARQLGAKVIDADIVAREVVKKGQTALEEIVRYFGTEVLLESGELDRKKLGRIVFADKEKLRLLNQITHKYIIHNIKEEIKIEMRKNTYNIIIIDAAILIESGLYEICDAVWVVVANKEERIRRIMERDQLSLTEAQNRINSQMAESEMKKYASAVINNDNDIESVRFQVTQLINQIE